MDHWECLFSQELLEVPVRTLLASLRRGLLAMRREHAGALEPAAVLAVVLQFHRSEGPISGDVQL